MLAFVLLVAGCTSASPTTLDPSASPTEPTVTGSGPASTVGRVRDVGLALGFPELRNSWDADAAELDGTPPAELVLSFHSGVQFYRFQGNRFASIFALGGDDRHGCTEADVDRDGLTDVYCTRGAHSGTITKANRLWMQPELDVFEDRAPEYGVIDAIGRGRFPTFVDLNGDPWPDLFIGNEYPRPDGLPSPNRTFVNVRGTRFREVDLGVTQERGSWCIQAADVDGDGWEDILLCGQERLILYRNVAGGSGHRELRDVAPRLGLDIPGVESATLADLDRDGRLDLVVVTPTQLSVYRGHGGSRWFRTPSYRRSLDAGKWVLVGNIDGERGPDIYVVQSCADGMGGTNDPDLLLLDRGAGWGVERVRVPGATRGCGDVAAIIDFDLDGADDVLVLNGMFRDPVGQGPIQMMTMGDWSP